MVVHPHIACVWSNGRSQHMLDKIDCPPSATRPSFTLNKIITIMCSSARPFCTCSYRLRRCRTALKRRWRRVDRGGGTRELMAQPCRRTKKKSNLLGSSQSILVKGIWIQKLLIYKILGQGQNLAKMQKNVELQSNVKSRGLGDHVKRFFFPRRQFDHPLVQPDDRMHI